MKMLPRWKLLFHQRKSKNTMFIEALARMSDLDIAKVTEDALGCCLPQFDQSDTLANPPQNIGSGNIVPAPVGESIEMKIRSNPLTCSSAAGAESHGQPQILLEVASAKTAAQHNPEASESKGSRQTRSQNQSEESSVFELQEVVVHGADETAGIPTSAVLQGRAVVRRSPNDASVCSSSKTSAVAVKSIKMISALALQQRGKRFANSVTAATQRHIEAAAGDDQMKRVDPFSSKMDSTSVHSEDSLQTSPQLIVFRAGDAVMQASVPQPPPRSRSSSRIRQISVSAAIAATGDDDVHLHQMSSQASTSVARGRASRKVNATMPNHSSLSPCDTPDALSAELQTQSTAVLPQSATKRRDETPARRDHLVQTSLFSASLQGTPSHPIAPPKSRSRSRIRVDSASNVAASALGVSPASSDEPARMAFAPETSLRSAGGIALSNAAKQEKLSASTSRRSSQGKLESSLKSRRLKKSDEPPPISWEQHIQMMKDRYGDQFEEC